MSSKNIIKKVQAREIINSRGWPTVEAIVYTDDGQFRASVPQGSSCGKRAAFVLYDEGSDYLGRGVQKAIQNIEVKINPALQGKSVFKQRDIDRTLNKLDGTEDKSNLGVNAILPVSLAVARAAAELKEIPLWQYLFELYQDGEGEIKIPKPSFNIINGGAHGGSLGIQEFMIIPQFEEYSFNLKAAVEIYHYLENLLEKKVGKMATNVGDEGGFTPSLGGPEIALGFILMAVKQAGYEGQVKIGLDCAATQFKKEDGYQLQGGFFTPKGLRHFYQDLIKKYPLEFIEDPFDEDSLEQFAALQKVTDITIVGDDLTTSQQKYIKQAHEAAAINGVIIKPNQVGTLSEVAGSIQLARSYGWKIIASHRSGETNDSFISDLAVGLGADFIKAGAPARGERTAKYNRFLEIQAELSSEK